MTSDARARAPEEDRVGDAARPPVADDEAAAPGPRADAAPTRPAVPVVPLLGALLVLLVAAAALLWSTRPDPSAIRTDTYVAALQAARSHVVDLTSFDHLTLDDDIREIEAITTGQLGEETIARLDERRQAILDAEAVTSTEVVGAGVTRADEDSATALLVIASTQQSNAGGQAELLRYRIEVELTKVDDRWLLSAIRGR
ncbi:hypothetical protein [Blastococcus sp. SYSU DS0619]